MKMIQAEFFAYFFILFSICSIWLFEKKRFALSFAILGLIIGFIVDLINAYGTLVIIVFGFSSWLYYRKGSHKFMRFTAFLSMAIIGFLLIASYIPGIENWRIIDAELIGESTVHYSLLLYVDKAFVAICLGVFGFIPLRRKLHLKYVMLRMLPVSIITLLLLSSLGLLLGVVNIDIKLPDLWLIWAITNLLTMCVSDELYHRFFLLAGIARFLGNGIPGKIIALIVSASMCTLTHPGPVNYMFMVFLAGIMFGVVFLQTRRVEATIILHFTVNVIHFLLFSYPMLHNSYAV